jgi:hypothetical protein
MYQESRRENKSLQEMIQTQSKSIGSLIFNMETSLEGKLRFIRKYESVTTSFFDLPAMKEFWIEHKTDKSLSLVSVGEVASANNPRREPPRFSGKRFAGKIEVEYIGK